MPSNDLLADLRARGLVHDVSDEAGLRERLARGPITFYCGYDPTATSLHAGNLVPLSVATRLARAGHRFIALCGGATGMVGDPSGKSAERKLLDEATLAANLAALRAQITRFVSADAILADNADWFRGIGYLQFLRDVGKHITVNYMLAKESVRARLEDREQGISYTEFSYMLLQGYDFVNLARTMGCELQIGGADQWGNITCGLELHRRMGGTTPIFGLVAPLLLTAAGTKFGKSEGGNVWLDPALTSPYQFYQYWLRSDDADVERYLKMFTFLELDEIARVLAAHDPDRARRVAQRRLAEEVTTWVHGAGGLAEAVETTKALFAGGPVAADALFAIEADASVADVCLRAGLVGSKSEARRLIEQRGVYLDGVAVEDVARKLGAADFAGRDHIRLSVGKKKHKLLRLS
jgi:tyrosyl-tRNA synthetase